MPSGTSVRIGEIDDRGYRHWPAYRKACFYEQPAECCWLCVLRITRDRWKSRQSYRKLRRQLRSGNEQRDD